MLQTNFKIKNYKLVTVRINTTAGKIMFPDLPDLRNVKTVAIEFYPLSVVSASVDNVACDGNFINAYLTLVSGNDEIVQSIDLASLNNFSGNDTEVSVNGFDDVINGYVFDYAKSYISYASGTAPTTPPKTLLFGVYYEK